jgi:HAD superfamily hydrolase (TIGR01509 family)
VLSASPFVIVNNTTINAQGDLAFEDQEIRIALYGKDFTDADHYYFTSAGDPVLTTTVSTLPTFLLSDLTKTGDHTYVINLPQDELWTTFRGRLVEQIRPDSVVIKLVTDLRSAGAKTGVITNGDARQVEKIQLAGLTDLFDVVLVSDTVGIRKPSPAIFQMALDEVGSMPAESLFVGDNPPVDIAGARSAGLATAWVRAGRDWPASLQRADYEADTLVGLRPSFF